MSVINIKNEIGGFDYAGSRGSGEPIREKIKQQIDAGHHVTLEFLGIEGISHSFADEIVGIIVRAYGVEFIKKGNLRLNNANEDIKSLLNLVIKESKKQSA
jgi:sugar-specific transcriptional regulator TrmB